jgi:uncharacterized membrane protein (UPF0182 family)
MLLKELQSLEHSLGDTNSAYTSWSTDMNVAKDFATSKGKESGVILTTTLPKDSVVMPSQAVQQMMNESERLIQGTVNNANVIKVR